MAMNSRQQQTLQPADYCRQAFNAIEVSEGRRKRRKRDTGPDVMGMDIKRDLLQRAIEEEPAPEEFESWLMEQVFRADAGGPIRAMAIEILADYQNACMFHSFNDWLAEGAPTPRVEDPARPRRRRD